MNNITTEYANTQAQQIDTIVTNWIRGVKLQATPQPLPTAAYGYGEGGAAYYAHGSYPGNKL